MDSATSWYRRGHNFAGRVLWTPEDLGPWAIGPHGQSSPKSMIHFLALLSSTLDTSFWVFFATDGRLPKRESCRLTSCRGGPLPCGLRRLSGVTIFGSRLA